MKAVVDGFSYMGMTRPARLEGPEVTYTFFEECEYSLVFDERLGWVRFDTDRLSCPTLL